MVGVFKGSTEIELLNLGGDGIAEVYVGSTKVYPARVYFVGGSVEAFPDIGSTTRYVDKPAGTVEGDLLIAFGSSRNSYIGNPPSGGATWNLLYSYSVQQTAIVAQGTTNEDAYVWWKFAGASEPAQYGFGITDSGASGQMLGVSAYRGASGVGVHSEVPVTDISPSITGVDLGMLLSIYTTALDPNYAQTLGVPAGMTLIGSGYTPNQCAGVMAYEALTAGGATGTREWTGNTWATFVINASILIEP